MLGPALALLAAMTFALNNATVRRGVLTGSAAQAMAITVPAGAVLSLLVMAGAGLLPTLALFDGSSLFWLCLAGMIHFVAGRYCNYRAIKAIGANLVGPVQELGLIWTIVLAVLLLGEVLTLRHILGIALVFLAPMLAFRRRPVPLLPAAGQAVFSPKYVEGYFFAGLSAIGFGTSPILVSAAIPLNSGVAGGLAATMISYCAATMLIGLILLWPGQLSHVLRTERAALTWFTVSGVVVFISQLTRYMALAIAPVSVVSAIQRTVLIFRLIFSRLINPGHEIFDRRIVSAAAVSLVGVLLLSLSANYLAKIVPLPPALVSFLELELVAGGFGLVGILGR